jgi:hypothetical protein
MKTNDVHLLKLEATAELAILLTVFNLSAASWWMLLALFLLPDLSILAYFWGTEAGATAYNLTHTYAVAIGTILAFYWISGFLPSPLWLVWPIHIAWDRMLGYGLKSPTSFHKTHLT